MLSWPRCPLQFWAGCLLLCEPKASWTCPPLNSLCSSVVVCPLISTPAQLWACDTKGLGQPLFPRIEPDLQDVWVSAIGYCLCNMYVIVCLNVYLIVMALWGLTSGKHIHLKNSLWDFRKNTQDYKEISYSHNTYLAMTKINIVTFALYFLFCSFVANPRTHDILPLNILGHSSKITIIFLCKHNTTLSFSVDCLAIIWISLSL